MKLEIKNYFIVIMANSFYILSFLIFPSLIFMRARRLFENFQPLDFIIMGLMVLCSIILSFYYSSKSIQITNLSLIMMSIITYLCWLLLPIMSFANQLLQQIEIFGIRMVQYSILYSAIIALSVFLSIQWSFYLDSTLYQMFKAEKNNEKTIISLISFLMATILFFISSIFYENSNTYFLIISIDSIISLLLIRLIFGKNGQIKTKDRNIIESKNDRKLLHNISQIIDWIIYSAVFIGAFFLYCFFLADDREPIYTNLISINMIFGSILIIPYLIFKKRKILSIFMKIMLICMSFLSLGMLFYTGINGNFYITRYFILGFSIIPITIIYIDQTINNNGSAIRLFLFTITWFVAAYFAMIPAKINELESFLALLKIGIPVTCFLKILNDVFLYEKKIQLLTKK